MSFGFSVGDFITVPGFAWRVYNLCKNSPAEFKTISSEVASLHTLLVITAELLEEHGLDPDREARLNSLRNGCEDVLKDLQRLLERYDSLGTKKRRIRDRMGWMLEDISAVKERLTTNITMLAAFNATLAKYVASICSPTTCACQLFCEKGNVG